MFYVAFAAGVSVLTNIVLLVKLTRLSNLAFIDSVENERLKAEMRQMMPSPIYTSSMIPTFRRPPDFLDDYGLLYPHEVRSSYVINEEP